MFNFCVLQWGQAQHFYICFSKRGALTNIYGRFGSKHELRPLSPNIEFAQKEQDSLY